MVDKLTADKADKVIFEGYKLGDLGAFKLDKNMVLTIIGSVFEGWLNQNKKEIISTISESIREDAMKNDQTAEQWNKLADSLEKIYDISERMKKDGIQENITDGRGRIIRDKNKVTPGTDTQDKIPGTLSP